MGNLSTDPARLLSEVSAADASGVAVPRPKPLRRPRVRSFAALLLLLLLLLLAHARLLMRAVATFDCVRPRGPTSGADGVWLQEFMRQEVLSV